MARVAGNAVNDEIKRGIEREEEKGSFRETQRWRRAVRGKNNNKTIVVEKNESSRKVS